jgi:aminoglycoside phosphotransferase
MSQVLYYHRAEANPASGTSREYLLMSAVPGYDSASHPWLKEKPEALIIAIAQALRQLQQDIQISGCPFDCTLASKLAAATSKARRKVERLREQGGDEAAQGEAEAVLEELSMMTVPATDPWDLVFSHGDYCLPNVLFSGEGELVGFIDVGAAGVSDRHFDVALALRSLEYNLRGVMEQARIDRLFLSEYQKGRERPLDHSKLQWCQRLDDLW